MENAVSTLSTDIHVITAEINAYQRVAGEAIFEIGKRLKHVKENDLAHGEWSKWCETIGIDRSNANKFIRIFDELDVVTSPRLGLDALYQIALMAPEQREQPHTIPSTGETKTVDEMTVRELREVKAELKKATEKAEQAETARQIAEQRELDAKRSAEIANRQNERLSDELAIATKPETVVVEKEVERIVPN